MWDGEDKEGQPMLAIYVVFSHIEQLVLYFYETVTLTKYKSLDIVKCESIWLTLITCQEIPPSLHWFFFHFFQGLK